MRRYVINFLAGILCIGNISAQLLTISPDFPKDTSSVSIIVDCTKGNQGLLNYSNTTDVYVHVGVITDSSAGPTDWRYVKFTWGTTNPAANATYLSANKYKYNINNIRGFFGVPANEKILRIAILFRNGAGTLVQRNADGSDMYIKVYDNNPASKFILPPFQPKYNPVPETITKTVGSTIDLNYVSSQTGTLSLYLNGTLLNSVSSSTSIQNSPTLSVAGNQQIVGRYTNGTVTLSDTINFYIAQPVTVAPLPPSVKDGINYMPGDTSVVLVLFAPGKSRVNVIGDFSNWLQLANYQLNKTPDSKYFWIQINGLTPSVEYAYQYLIDDSIKVADYYTEKILDPDNDPSIPPATYPGLKPYPTGKTTGIVSVLQTASPQYGWKNTSFSKPDKKNLLIYELLVRDFVAAHDYKTLKDTLSYLKRLGINAIELMPVNEFEGNISWGYNPSFYFAPDKYYGPKNTLKEFIDSCHSNGIAVIMDIVLNHSFGQSPMVQMYFNNATGKVAADNPWYNVITPHAFGFGFDFNHESDATKYFVDRVTEFWLTEYKMDGYRFDFTKGFTQKVSTTDGEFSAYDPSRIAILKRINNFIKSKVSDAYVILEHFTDNSEELELSNEGMMIWGNLNYNFNEATMGYLANSNFEWGIYTKRNYTQPLLLTYMESHDEERLMYKNIKYGNQSQTYNVKDTGIALKRNEMAAAFYYSIPGPKMVWEFGELGYDYSRCYLSTNGENGDCNKKLDPKPIRWDYQADLGRKRLFEIYSALMKLRKDYPNPFTSGTISFSLNGAFKIIQLSHTDLNITVIGNFDVNPVTGSVTFQNAGNWYDYLTGGPYPEGSGAQTFTLAPGAYKFFVNKNIVNAVFTAINEVPGNGDFDVSVIPNPATPATRIHLNLAHASDISFSLYDSRGRLMVNTKGKLFPQGTHDVLLNEISSIQKLSKGVYLLTVNSGLKRTTRKIVL